jgi:hypothetical protein
MALRRDFTGRAHLFFVRKRQTENKASATLQKAFSLNDSFNKGLFIHI